MQQNGARSLLLIDADAGERRVVAAIAGRAGWRVLSAEDWGGAAAHLADDAEGEIAAALVGGWRPGLPACALRAVRAEHPELPALAVIGDEHAGVAALRGG